MKTDEDLEDICLKFGTLWHGLVAYAGGNGFDRATGCTKVNGDNILVVFSHFDMRKTRVLTADRDMERYYHTCTRPRPDVQPNIGLGSGTRVGAIPSWT